MISYSKISENIESNLLSYKEKFHSTTRRQMVYGMTGFLIVGVTLLAVYFKGTANYGIIPSSSYPYNPHNINHYSIDSLTRDVDVIPIHSHNDYWRHEPLFDAIKVGAKSVEADIWFFDDSDVFEKGELYVGHNLIYLQKTHTLNSLYLDNLWNLLGEANDNFEDSAHESKDITQTKETESKYGIFYNEPETSLFLFIDVKTDGFKTLAKLEDYLTRFLENGYLTYFNIEKNELIQGPITVITTGNVPIEFYDEKKKLRFTFPDAPLSLFTQENFESSEENKSLINKFKSYSIIASCSMQEIITNFKSNRGTLSENDSVKLKKTFDNCHSANLQTRIWGTPNWPNFIRDDVWSKLIEAGTDLLNVDALRDAKNKF